MLATGLKLRKIMNAVPIIERPPEVEDRAVPGHWEGDLIVGSNNSYIATLEERHSRFVMLAKVDNKDTQSVTAALIKQARKLPKELYKSLTWDRGSEMAGHAKFTMATNIDVYFCDPSHLGNEEAMKIPIDCFANTSQKAPTYPTLAKRNSAPSPASLTRDLERPCNTKLLSRRFRQTYRMLRSPFEIAGTK